MTELHAQAARLGLLTATLAAGMPAGLTRAPTPVEVESRTSYASLEQDVASTAADLASLAIGARDRAIAAIAGVVVTAGSVDAVLEQLDAWAAGLSIVPGAGLIVDELQAAVTTRLGTLASLSLARALADATRAGVPGVRDVGLLTSQHVALEAQARRVASEAAAAALRAMRGGAYSTGRPDRTDVLGFTERAQAAAHATGTRELEDVAHQAALRGAGAGRVSAMTALTEQAEVVVYASELLDRNTCAPCSLVDGTDYASMEAALEDYPSGQYEGCLGGPRCRGTLVVVSAGERPATLAVPGDALGDLTTREPVRSL